MKSKCKYALLVLMGALLSGCATTPTFLNPNSSVAADEATLYNELLWEAVGVFAIVAGILIWILIRDHGRSPKDVQIPKLYLNPRKEVTWVIIPVLLVVSLDAFDFVLMLHTMNVTTAPAPQQSDVNLKVIGHRWWWEFDYPDLNIKTANELHVPVGTVVQADVTGYDVIHSFWIPQLTGKQDAIPGQINHVWFKADKVGEFHGQCVEFCGQNHANMRIKVVVQSQKDFDAWVANQQKPAPQPQNDQQKAGYDLIATGVCSSCHTLNGTKGDADVGPNLTHLFSRSVFAGATLDTTPDNVRAWIKDTQAFKPGNDMNINVSQKQLDDLMSYIVLLK